MGLTSLIGKSMLWEKDKMFITLFSPFSNSFKKCFFPSIFKGSPSDLGTKVLQKILKYHPRTPRAF